MESFIKARGIVKHKYTLSTEILGNLNLPTGEIVICDPINAFLGTQLEVQFPKGSYTVFGTVAKDPESKESFFAYAFIEFKEDSDITWIKLNKHVSVSGNASFMDRNTAEVLEKNAKAEYYSIITRKLNKVKKSQYSSLNIAVDDKSLQNYIIFTSGFGNGTYTSYVGVNDKKEICYLLLDLNVLNGKRPVKLNKTKALSKLNTQIKLALGVATILLIVGLLPLISNNRTPKSKKPTGNNTIEFLELEPETAIERIQSIKFNADEITDLSSAGLPNIYTLNSEIKLDSSVTRYENDSGFTFAIPNELYPYSQDETVPTLEEKYNMLKSKQRIYFRDIKIVSDSEKANSKENSSIKNVFKLTLEKESCFPEQSLDWNIKAYIISYFSGYDYVGYKRLTGQMTEESKKVWKNAYLYIFRELSSDEFSFLFALQSVDNSIFYIKLEGNKEYFLKHEDMVAKILQSIKPIAKVSAMNTSKCYLETDEHFKNRITQAIEQIRDSCKANSKNKKCPYNYEFSTSIENYPKVVDAKTKREVKPPPVLPKNLEIKLDFDVCVKDNSKKYLVILVNGSIVGNERLDTFKKDECFAKNITIKEFTGKLTVGVRSEYFLPSTQENFFEQELRELLLGREYGKVKITID